MTQLQKINELRTLGHTPVAHQTGDIFEMVMVPSTTTNDILIEKSTRVWLARPTHTKSGVPQYTPQTPSIA